MHEQAEQRRDEWSLQARLAWRLAAVMAIAIALAGAAVAWRALETVNSLEDQALQAQARDIQRNLMVASDGAAKLFLPPDLDAAYRYSADADLYLVLDQTGHVVAASSSEASTILEPFLRDKSTGFFRSAPVRYYGFATSTDGIRIAVAQDGHHQDVLRDSLRDEFSIAALWLLVPIGCAAVLVGVLTIRSGLRPLSSASIAATEIGPEQPARRLPLTGMPREIRPLVAAVNSALDRLARGLDVQRRFTADAAHELRTPLSVLTARLDALPGGDIDAMRRDVDRMNRLVEQLLKMARLESLPLDVAQFVDLNDVVIEAISRLAPLAIRQGKELVRAEVAKPVMVHGNRAALVTALVNLIENALAHAPAGSAIEVELSGDGKIQVLDRGPGVPDSEREAIFRRFHRGRSRGTSGAGLGLAIVAEIAAAHGGSVSAASRPGGGAAFCLNIASVSVM
jgi:two-component system, OmpR family, sensor histidine kinase TctE